jgi:choline dehydrogenase-like flavoprotein
MGTGCGGGSIGARLAAAGLRVVFIERGGHYTKADFDQREDHMLAKIDGGRGLDASEDLSVSLTYGNNVGGASVHYWADSSAHRPSSEAVAGGSARAHQPVLTPHFEQIERDLNVHLATDQYVNRMNELLAEGARKLGWSVNRVPQARKGCVSSGHCMQGCSYDAKQSQLVTYVPRAISRCAAVADTRVDVLRRDGRRVSECKPRSWTASASTSTGWSCARVRS